MIRYHNALPFPATFVGITTSAEKYMQEMDRLGTGMINGWPRDNAAAHATLYRNDEMGNFGIICIDPEKVKHFDTIETLALIVHEITHLKQFIFEYFGEESPGAEHEAYFMQWMTVFLLRDIANGA